MLPVLVSALVAWLFARYSWMALTRGIDLFRLGYWRIHTMVTRYEDFRRHVAARAEISEAGVYIIGGVLWFAAGCLFVGLAFYFAWQIFVWL